MPKIDITDQEVVEILATRGMQWPTSVERHPYKGIRCRLEWWNPLTDLNACHEVEERLTEEQRSEYMFALIDAAVQDKPKAYWDKPEATYWDIRHADARTCAYALAEVLRGGKDERRMQTFDWICG